MALWQCSTMLLLLTLVVAAHGFMSPGYSTTEYASVLIPHSILIMLGVVWTHEAVQPKKPSKVAKEEAPLKTQ